MRVEALEAHPIDEWCYGLIRLMSMNVLINFVVGLHIIGIAALLGGAIAQLGVFARTSAAGAEEGGGEARIVPAMLYGAWTMLATGLVLVGLNQAGHHHLNTVKIGLKAAILVVILGLVYVKRDEETVEKGVIAAVGGLTVANVFIAVLWT
jgi:hypothetical protein